MKRIPVGISGCLAGQSVRHDGSHRRARALEGVLEAHLELVPFCPEAGAGLGVPRPALRLVRGDDGIRLREVKSGIDRTEALDTWSRWNLPRMGELSGFILMGKSPSCGLEQVRVYSETGFPRREGRGVFARALVEALPWLPVEEEGRLHDDTLRENFLERVFVFDEWQGLCRDGLTAEGLLRFHREHKFQLLAHCQPSYRRLGRMLADLRGANLDALAERYIREFMEAMKKPVSRGGHVNAMLHILGFFRGRTGEVEHRAIKESIDAYLREEVPLVVPMTLLRLAQRRFPDPYLDGQRYLAPYPDALGLRNRV